MSKVAAKTHVPPQGSDKITIHDFVAYLPTHSYIFTPCREPWVRGGVNACVAPVPALDGAGQPKVANGKRVMLKATEWLDRNRAVQQFVWYPGETDLVADHLVVDGGFIHRKGVQIFNSYRPPRLELGDATQAGRWVEHLHSIYSEQDATHIARWLAQRVQRPSEKINHALVMGGHPGIGKDTLLEPVKHAVGPWNFQEINPAQLLGLFNHFIKSIVLRVSEAHDLGEFNRFSFYERSKLYTAAPPDVLRVNEKHIREYYVFNVVGMVITTNHKTDGIYLPADDRRHYVAWSSRTKEDFTDDYWRAFWHWYQHEGGFGHVASYLATLDLSGFDLVCVKTHLVI
jgi:hypothetical protein